MCATTSESTVKTRSVQCVERIFAWVVVSALCCGTVLAAVASAQPDAQGATPPDTTQPPPASPPQVPATSEDEGKMSVEDYCKASANAETPVCKAFAAGKCVVGLKVALCRERLKTPWDRVRETFLNSTLVDGILGLLTAAAATGLAYLRRRLKELEKRLGDPFFASTIQSAFETKGVNLVLVGEGGSGKTSIIRALSGSKIANPAQTTLTLDTYNLVWEVDVNRGGNSKARRITRVYVEDYRGQATKDLAFNTTVVERENSIPATVMVIVVDLFRAVGPLGPPASPSANWDDDRVSLQETQYSETTLDILAGISKRIVHVCLFINKADLIRPYTRDSTANIRNRYMALATRITQEFGGVRFTSIVGSATSGWGIVGHDEADSNTKTLLEILADASVDIKL